MIDWSDYPNFTEAEMRCHCGCGQGDMDPTFMAALQRVRNAFGRPMSVTSGFRCKDYDKRIGGAGVHPTGQAADIAISGENVYHLLSAAITMRGIGLKQHGAHATRFIHLDMTDGPMRPRIWSYP
jgi:uncharacterized protein YcbK (DUF882 family)